MLSPLDPWLARRIGQTGGPSPDPAALARWQAARLLRALERARRRSPFYADRLPATPRAADDPGAVLCDLPRMTPGDIRKHATALLAVSQGEVERVVSLDTSGTTGAPKRIFFSAQDLADTLAFFRVGLTGFVAPGDTALILLPGRRPDGAADLLARALADIGARPVLAPQGLAPAQAAHLALKTKADCLAALPSQLAALLPHAGKGLPARRALLSGEPVAPGLRETADLAGIELFVHYGLTETCFGAGVECTAHDGYHLREADLYLEIVDPLTGQPVRQGDEGEVVITTLGHRAMPLVRYRTGDWGRMLAGPCPCGSPLRRLGPLAGRIEPASDGYRVSVPPKGGGTCP